MINHEISLIVNFVGNCISLQAVTSQWRRNDRCHGASPVSQRRPERSVVNEFFIVFCDILQFLVETAAMSSRPSTKKGAWSLSVC